LVKRLEIVNKIYNIMRDFFDLIKEALEDWVGLASSFYMIWVDEALPSFLTYRNMNIFGYILLYWVPVLYGVIITLGLMVLMIIVMAFALCVGAIVIVGIGIIGGIRLLCFKQK